MSMFEVKISSIPRTQRNVLVLSCPEPSLAGVVAIEYLIDTLNMEEIGAIRIRDVPPVIAVVDGVAKLPHRIFYRRDLGLVAIRQHVPVPPQIYSGFIGKILDWAEENNIDKVICLSAMPTIGEKEVDNVYFVTEDILAGELTSLGLIPLKEATISGLEGAFLDAVLSRRARGVLLLAESKLLSSIRRLAEGGKIGSHKDLMLILHDLVGKVGPDVSAALKLLRGLEKLLGARIPLENLEQHASKYSFLVEKNLELYLQPPKPTPREIPLVY